MLHYYTGRLKDSLVTGSTKKVKAQMPAMLPKRLLNRVCDRCLLPTSLSTSISPCSVSSLFAVIYLDEIPMSFEFQSQSTMEEYDHKYYYEPKL